MDETKKYLESELANTNVVDMSKLPRTMRMITNDYLSKVFPKLEKEMLILSLLEYAAYICAYNQATVYSERLVKSKTYTTPINMYCITFKPSGGYKDALATHFRGDLLKEVIDVFKSRKTIYYNDAKKTIEEKAKVLFPDSVPSQVIYKKENAIRELRLFSSNGTVQGLYSDRHAYSKAGFGSSFYVIREAGAFFKTFSRDKEEIIELLNIAYDLGTTEGVSIKKDFEETPEFELPSMFHMHGSAISFDKPQVNEKILEILEEGMARRSFLFFSDAKDDIESKIKTPEEILAEIKRNTQEFLERKEGVVSIFNEIHQATKNKLKLTLSEGAEDYMTIYQYYSQNMRDKGSENLLNIEIEGRSWKALKIAGAIELLENPHSKQISLASVKAAVYLTEVFGNNYKLFGDRNVSNDVEKVYSLILEAKDFVRASEIKNKLNVYRRNLNFDRIMQDVEEIALGRDMEFVVDENHKGVRYKIIKPEPNSLKNLVISQNSSNKTVDTTYETLSIPWEAMHKITGMSKGYSFSTYKNAKRSQKNAEGRISLLGIDVDGGFSLDDAKAYVEKQNWTALITTTKSHQKEKITDSGNVIPATDRFRIILPFKYVFNGDVEKYRKNVQNFFKTLPFQPDTVTEDIARFWFGNPNQEYVYFKGNLFDFSVYQDLSTERRDLNSRTNLGKSQDKNSKIGDKNDKKSRKRRINLSELPTLKEIFTSDKEEFLRRISFAPDGKNGQDGGRNDMLARVGRWAKEEGMNVEEVLKWINNEFTEQIDDREMSTIIKSIG